MPPTPALLSPISFFLLCFALLISNVTYVIEIRIYSLWLFVNKWYRSFTFRTEGLWQQYSLSEQQKLSTLAAIRYMGKWVTWNTNNTRVWSNSSMFNKTNYQVTYQVRRAYSRWSGTGTTKHRKGPRGPQSTAGGPQGTHDSTGMGHNKQLKRVEMWLIWSK